MTRLREEPQPEHAPRSIRPLVSLRRKGTTKKQNLIIQTGVTTKAKQNLKMLTPGKEQTKRNEAESAVAPDSLETTS